MMILIQNHPSPEIVLSMVVFVTMHPAKFLSQVLNFIFMGTACETRVLWCKILNTSVIRILAFTRYILSIKLSLHHHVVYFNAFQKYPSQKLSTFWSTCILSEQMYQSQNWAVHLGYS